MEVAVLEAVAVAAIDSTRMSKRKMPSLRRSLGIATGALLATGSAKTATTQAFEAIDMDRLAKLFKDFWMSRSRRSSAARKAIRRIP